MENQRLKISSSGAEERDPHPETCQLANENDKQLKTSVKQNDDGE